MPLGLITTLGGSYGIGGMSRRFSSRHACEYGSLFIASKQARPLPGLFLSAGPRAPSSSAWSARWAFSFLANSYTMLVRLDSVVSLPAFSNTITSKTSSMMACPGRFHRGLTGFSRRSTGCRLQPRSRRPCACSIATDVNWSRLSLALDEEAPLDGARYQFPESWPKATLKWKAE